VHALSLLLCALALCLNAPCVWRLLQDKIVLLEYELRLSKDDIQSLKTELKQLRTRQLRQGESSLHFLSLSLARSPLACAAGPHAVCHQTLRRTWRPLGRLCLAARRQGRSEANSQAITSSRRRARV
jgi:hypothetical protein